MKIIDGMIMELQYECGLTRKVLERVPDDKFDYKPHPKSMAMGELASHLADSVGWAVPTAQLDEMEFDPATWKPWLAKRSAELVAKLEEQRQAAVDAMQPLSNEDLIKTWRMVTPDGKVLLEMPRVQVLRAMVLSHMIHHRAQLAMYLRLNDVPVPSIYGPSADEQG